MARAGLRRGEVTGLRREDMHLVSDATMLGCAVPGARPGRAARRARVLGGNVVGLADQRRMGGARRDHPAGGQVPALHGPVAQPCVRRVNQVGVGALTIPDLPPRVPRVGEDRCYRTQCPRYSRAVRVPLGVGGGRTRDTGVVQRPGDPGGAVPGQPLGEYPRHHRRGGRIRLQPVRTPHAPCSGAGPRPPAGTRTAGGHPGIGLARGADPDLRPGNLPLGLEPQRHHRLLMILSVKVDPPAHLRRP